MMKHDEKPALSFPVRLAQISARAVDVHIEANADERQALSNVWNVVDVLSLTADLQIARWKKDGLKVAGRVSARIVQACVVTLDPVISDIDEPVEAFFVPEGSRLAKALAGDGVELVIDPDGPDLPDLFAGDTVDIGMTVAEHAALAIDPYPRKDGAHFGERIESDGKDDVKPNSFAVLKDWKKD